MTIRSRSRKGSRSSFSGTSIKRLLLGLPYCFSCTHAQSYFVPTTAFGSYSVFIEDKAIYVALGGTITAYAHQTFSLDLTSSWDTTSPKFTQLSNLGAPVDYLVPNMLLNDQSWLVLSNNRSYRYNVQANTWSTVATLTNLFPINEWILSGATDPSTGLVYIPNGYFVSTPTLNTTTMMQYNVATGTTTSLPMINGPGGVRAFAIAWNQAIRKIVVTSGFVNQITIHGLYTYDALAGWTQPTATGMSPPPREQHCMVSAGAKMVMYGGFTDRTQTVVMSDIWILDLTSWTWTQGANAGASNARANHVCGYSNDQFIVWGGKGKDTVVTNNITMIYNLNTQAWTTTFVPNPAIVTATTTTNSRASGTSSGSSTPMGSGANSVNGPDSSGSKTNIGVIVGIVAAVTIICVFAGFIIYRRKKAIPQPVEYDYSGNKYQPQPGSAPSNFDPLQTGSPPNSHGSGPVQVQVGSSPYSYSGPVPVQVGSGNPGSSGTYQTVPAATAAMHINTQGWTPPVMSTSVSIGQQYGQHSQLSQAQFGHLLPQPPSQPLQPYQPYQGYQHVAFAVPQPAPSVASVQPSTQPNSNPWQQSPSSTPSTVHNLNVSPTMSSQSEGNYASPTNSTPLPNHLETRQSFVERLAAPPIPPRAPQVHDP